MASSGKVLVPIFLLVSILCTVSVIYGALEMSDGERSALEVLQDLISGKLSLKDIWNALTGEDDKADDKAEGTCAGPDTNGVYEFDVDGNCVKLSCKPGYFEQGGICIQQRDLSDDVYTGEVDVDCEISGYQLSECRNALSGDVLTGDIGSCGVGQQTKTPITSSVQIGLTGTCEQPTTVDCEVPCPLECEAPESLWAPTGDAKCRAIHNGTPVVLGDIDPVTGFGYCGQGTRINTLSEGNITGSDQGGMNLEDYKSSINWSLCETEKLGNCPPTPCTENLIDIGCPTPEDSWDWIFANEGAVYTTESAEKVIGREIPMGDATLMEGVTRTQAIDLGVLNTEGTAVLDETKMPMGRKIRFKAGEQNSYEYLTEKKCSIVELVPAYAPRISADCVYEYGYGECAEIGCGQMLKKWKSPVTTKMAWGNGTCNPPQAIQVDCSTQSASCCDTSLVGAWTEVEGYDGCVADVDGQYRRKSIRTGNGTLCSEPNEQLGALCSYDCKLEEIGLEHTGESVSWNRMGCNQKYNEQKITSISLRAAKGGTVCPAIAVNDTFNTSKQVSAKLEGVDVTTVSVPDFKCGRWLYGGRCGIPNMDYDNGSCDNGYNCGDGDKFSGMVGWYRRVPFQKNC